MSERDEHRIRSRKRQGLVWLASYPGWDQLLDTLSETGELHAPTEWVVTFLDENMGRLHFASTDGNTVSEALEAFAAVMSSRACHRCGAPGQARGYGLIPGARALIPTQLQTRCARCHGNDESGTAADEGPSADRVLTRERQGLGWLPGYPGWEHLARRALRKRRAARAGAVESDPRRPEDGAPAVRERRRERSDPGARGLRCRDELAHVLRVRRAGATARVRAHAERERHDTKPIRDAVRAMPPGRDARRNRKGGAER